MAGEPVTDPSSPLSWRDVYRAVGESEARVIASIQASVLPLTQAQADHEKRLRAVESMAVTVPAMKIEETALTLRVTALEQHNQREQGVFTTLGAGKTAIMFVAACVGPVLAVIALVTK